MANVSYEAFIPEVAPHVNGAPQPVILKAIRDAVIEFCDESGVINRTLDSILVPAGSQEFDLDVPGGERVCGVKNLTEEQSGEELSKSLYRCDGSVITFSTWLPMSVNIVATVSTKPKRSSKGCDESLYEDWLQGIVAGALFLLQSMNGREWADNTSALINERVFRKYIVKAKHYSRTGRVNGLGKIRQRSFE